MLNALIRSSLSHRPLVLLAALAVSIGGLIAGRALPIDVLPDLNRPTVAILTEAPGLAAEEVEAQITFPIGSTVSGAAGVERVRSVSSMGLSVIHIEFGWGGSGLLGNGGGVEGVFRHRQTIQERLLQVRERLPAGV